MAGEERFKEPTKARLIAEYRAKAKRCRSEADVARVIEERVQLEKTALAWEKLAGELAREELAAADHANPKITFDPNPVPTDDSWNLSYSLSDGRRDCVTGFISEDQARRWLEKAAAEWARLRGFSL
jgi:hypothetical protein